MWTIRKLKNSRLNKLFSANVNGFKKFVTGVFNFVVSAARENKEVARCERIGAVFIAHGTCTVKHVHALVTIVVFMPSECGTGQQATFGNALDVGDFVFRNQNLFGAGTVMGGGKRKITGELFNNFHKKI